VKISNLHMWILCSSVAALAVLPSGRASAQATAQAQASSGELEEIVVTARRRDEVIQKIPVAITAFTAKDLSQKAIHVEQVLLQENVGVQDQLHAAFGGMNRFDFIDGRTRITPVQMTTECQDYLLSSLVLVYTGKTRFASQVLTEQVSRATSRATTHETSSEAWPVPPGRGADYPMARELAVDAAHAQAGRTVTVVAAGAVLAQLEDADGPFAAGTRKLTDDGLARFVLRGRDAGRWSGGHPVDVVVLDVHEQEVDRVRARVADPWAKEIDGPEATTDASPVH